MAWSMFMNWLNGWRWDKDGWLVRARREGDPEHLSPEAGFVEEACVAVRGVKMARALDKGLPQ